MTKRSVYLAIYRISRTQRAHFAIFIPNADHDNHDLSHVFAERPHKGTIIQVIGEPVMAGYKLEFTRNYDCSDLLDLKKMVLLGHVDATITYNPPSELLVKEDIPRSELEREAAEIFPPSRGQNIRAPIDGVNTRRCQEWTMEYLTRLVERGLIDSEAVVTAQEERDAPDHGIFGLKRAA